MLRRWPLLLALTACSTFGDAPAGADASADAAAADGGVDGADLPCTAGTVLVGSNVTDNKATDTVPRNGMDAYGFPVTLAGNARCAWLYLPQPVAGGLVVMGVYANGGDAGADQPDRLLASATFENPNIGWNAARLSKHLDLGPSDVVWLGVEPPNGGMSDAITTDKCTTTYFLHGALDVLQSPPDPFVTHSTDAKSCDLSAYLAP